MTCILVAFGKPEKNTLIWQAPNLVHHFSANYKSQNCQVFLKNNPKEQGAKVSRMEADIYPWGLLGIQIMSVGIVRNNILIHVD